MLHQFNIDVTSYKFDDALNLELVSKSIDDILIAHFKGRKVIIRGIQSEKHKLSKEQLVRQIIQTGTDRYESESDKEVIVSDKPIDLFGYACKIDTPPIVLPILEGFHKWKPKSLERPQRRVDIWIIFDQRYLQNVGYIHNAYGVKANDGYLFKNPNQKKDALLGLFVIN